MKAISLWVYKHKGEDFSNGGITSRYDEVLIECKDGYIEVDENNLPENFCRVVVMRIGDRAYKYLEPCASPDKGCVGWMSGGCYAESCDSRFSRISEYPLSIHDRQETQEQYDLFSR